MPDPTQPVPGPTREQTVTYTNWLGNQVERNAIPDRYDLAELRDLHKRAKRGPGGPPAHDAVDALVWLIDAVEALLPASPSPTDDDPERSWQELQIDRLKGRPIGACSHGRPDHQELIRQLLEALGMSTAARPYSAARLFGECLAEIERLREQNTALGVRIQQGWAEIERLRAHQEPTEEPT